MSPHSHIGLSSEHLEGNGGVGRYVLLPGDPRRAERIAEHFVEGVRLPNPRGHDAFLGRLPSPEGGEPIDTLAIATGMGPASTEIIVHELLDCGARRLVRVGSCGTLNPAITPGQVIIASGAVRDEKTTDHYAPPEYPALAHPRAVAALSQGAHIAGLADETFVGICHTKDSFYAREFGHGPAGEANLDYNSWLKRCGVVASEMEASVLFVLAGAASGTPAPLSQGAAGEEREAGAVMAVYGTDDPDATPDPELVTLAEQRAIRVALAGIAAWSARDRLDRERER